MQLSRRAFGTLAARGAAMLGLTSTVAMTAGCPAFLSSIYTDIKAYGPTVLAAIATVISILVSGGVLAMPLAAAISSIIALISKSIADLMTAVNNYLNAPAANKSTLLGVVATDLADAEANVQQFWNDLTIPDPALATLVKNLLSVVISTLQGYINALPAQAASSTPAMVKRNSLPNLINVPAKRRSLSQFKSDFNAYLKPTKFAYHTL
jgi:hypothetical protein